jgi:6-phosphogluconolactonase
MTLSKRARSFAMHQIDQENGNLTYVENQPTQGKTPRHFAIDPGGKYLLAENQDSNTIVPFSINPETGRLSPTGQIVEGVGAPVCIKFVQTTPR